MPVITVAFEPFIRLVVSNVSSGVHEQSYSPDMRYTGPVSYTHLTLPTILRV